jgi:hypothetical protein
MAAVMEDVATCIGVIESTHKRVPDIESGDEAMQRVRFDDGSGVERQPGVGPGSQTGRPAPFRNQADKRRPKVNKAGSDLSKYSHTSSARADFDAEDGLNLVAVRKEFIVRIHIGLSFDSELPGEIESEPRANGGLAPSCQDGTKLPQLDNRNLPAYFHPREIRRRLASGLNGQRKYESDERKMACPPH